MHLIIEIHRLIYGFFVTWRLVGWLVVLQASIFFDPSFSGGLGYPDALDGGAAAFENPDKKHGMIGR